MNGYDGLTERAVTRLSALCPYAFLMDPTRLKLDGGRVSVDPDYIGCKAMDQICYYANRLGAMKDCSLPLVLKID